MDRSPVRLALVLLLAIPGVLAAQDSVAKRDGAVAKLNTGQQIRISGAAMNRLIGKAGVALNDTLDVAQDDAVRRIPIPEIDTLWVRGQSAKDGAVIGGAVVGSLLAIFNLAWRGGCEEVDCPSAPLSALGGFLVGGAVGALVGGGIGSAVRSWKQTYP